MNRVINCTKINWSKNFEKNILKHFPKDCGDIFLDVVGMFRDRFYGARYLNKAVFIIDGKCLELIVTHNDSIGWDDYTDWESHERKYQNWAKSTVLYLLSENKEKITEFLTEELV